MDLRRALRREVVHEPAVLRGLAALACVALLWGLLRLGAAEQQNRARFWIDWGSVAGADYRRFRERFSATDLRVWRLRLDPVREASQSLSITLGAAPGALDVLSPSMLDPNWHDSSTASLPYGCDSTGACYHMDDLRWAHARSLWGPLSVEMRLLNFDTDTAHLAVFARSQLDGSWGWNAPDPAESFYEEEASHQRPHPEFALLPRAHTWLEQQPWYLLVGAACLLAFRRHCWRLALAAVGTAALAAAASEAVLVAARRTASIAEPSAECLIFVLVLGAALDVLNAERTALWLSGAENPWRAASAGAGRATLGLGALGLGSASFAVLPVEGLRCFALQSAAGLVLGAALVGSLVPTLAALLPRQKARAAVPSAPPGSARWERWVLLGGLSAGGAMVVWMLPVTHSFSGHTNWSGIFLLVGLLFGLPLAFVLLRRGPGWLQRRSPLQPPAPQPEPLQRVLDVYVAGLVVLYAISVPQWLTAAPGSADRLSPEAPFPREAASVWYNAVPLTRLELVLTTPEPQLTASGLVRLERLAARLKASLPTFAVVQPNLLLREAAYQLDRPESLPGPWLASAGLAGRLLQQYVADAGRTTRMTVLLEPPPGRTPVDFARRLPIEAIARQVKAELPEAELEITGPERLVSEAALDPLRLAALLVLALGVASSLPRLLQRAVPPTG